MYTYTCMYMYIHKYIYEQSMLDVTLLIVAAIEENGKEAVHEEFEDLGEDDEPDPDRKPKW